VLRCIPVVEDMRDVSPRENVLLAGLDDTVMNHGSTAEVLIFERVDVVEKVLVDPWERGADAPTTYLEVLPDVAGVTTSERVLCLPRHIVADEDVGAECSLEWERLIVAVHDGCRKAVVRCILKVIVFDYEATEIPKLVL